MDSDFYTRILVPGAQGPKGDQGIQGVGLQDGDKGDIAISTGVMHFMRTNGSPADGESPDDPWWNDMLAAGKSVILSEQKRYLLQSSVIYQENDTGIICPAGGALIIMDDSAGAFDNADSSSLYRYATNAVGITAIGIERPVLQGVRIRYGLDPDAIADDRYTKAVHFGNCTHIVCRHNEAWHFSKAIGILVFNGCIEGVIDGNHVHDSYTNSATNGQITGIETDNDVTLYGHGSKKLHIINNRIHDITVGARFLALGSGNSINYQTDGIQIGGTTYESQELVIANNRIDNVGEGIDNYGTGNVISGNNVSRCYLAGLKNAHGARDNLICGNNLRSIGLVGIVIGGSLVPTVTHNAANNTIIGNKITGLDYLGHFHANGSTAYGIGWADPGLKWTAGETVASGAKRFYENGYFTAASAGTCGVSPPVHTTGTASDDGVLWTYTGFAAIVTGNRIINNDIDLGNTQIDPSNLEKGNWGILAFGGHDNEAVGNRIVNYRDGAIYNNLGGLSLIQGYDLSSSFTDFIAANNLWTGQQKFFDFLSQRAGVTLVNGLNSNVLATTLTASITGVTGAFSIGGFQNPVSGQRRLIYNPTSFAMTIVNEDASTPPLNRIKTLTGANVVLPADSLFEVEYMTTGSPGDRWVVIRTRP